MRGIFVFLVALALSSPTFADEPADVQIQPQTSEVPNIKACQIVATYRGQQLPQWPLSKFDPAMAEMLGLPDAKVHYFDFSKYRSPCGISLVLDSYVIQGSRKTTSGIRPLNTIILRQTRDVIAFVAKEVVASDTWEEVYNISLTGF